MKSLGIKTERLAFGTFVTMGVLAALAGLVFTARLNSATPKAGTKPNGFSKGKVSLETVLNTLIERTGKEWTAW